MIDQMNQDTLQANLLRESIKQADVIILTRRTSGPGETGVDYKMCVWGAPNQGPASIRLDLYLGDLNPMVETEQMIMALIEDIKGRQIQMTYQWRGGDGWQPLTRAVFA